MTSIMGSTALPDKTSPDLRLARATEEEWLAQQLVNSDEWKGLLSLHSYLKREKHLSNQDLTRDGGITAWVLVWEPNSNGQRTVLCACETINKRAFAARRGSVEEVISHGVASVYCPAQYRGKGYAGRMMTELGDRINRWQTDSGKTALFSLLTSRHLPELCAYDEKLLHRRMSQIKPSSRTTVAVVPDVRHAAWHHAREEFVANEVHGKTPEVKGAMVGDKEGSRVWAYWTRVWANPQEPSPSTLHILRLVIEDDASSNFAPADVETAKSLKDCHVARAISSIFTVAQSEARMWDLHEVMLWNPSSAALAAAQLIAPNAAVEHRETESITSLRWYGEGSWKDVEWICNEKYGWC
ncbi:hypothetical protein AC579_2512 [Pseudocercospora musae]|uniref:LYC1 C-terminal domain-containing protein n=1 Tax=Pseudocercospora musae TaxID=113226 RepID=A0A139I4G5_9PEZI|nr:hypothetical protein AC579_2512 [Pseudocercospora musae]